VERTVESDGNLALHLAVELGNQQVFSYLLAVLKVRDHMRQQDKNRFWDLFRPARVVVETKNNHQVTPLLLSAKKNQQKIF